MHCFSRFMILILASCNERYGKQVVSEEDGNKN